MYQLLVRLCPLHTLLTLRNGNREYVPVSDTCLVIDYGGVRSTYASLSQMGWLRFLHPVSAV